MTFLNFQKQFLCISLFVTATINLSAKGVSIYTDPSSHQVKFALEELHKSLFRANIQIEHFPLTNLRKPDNSTQIILLSIDNPEALSILKKWEIKPEAGLKSEGFSIRKTGKSTIWIIGKDDAGLMYGGLEVAEVISTEGIETVKEKFTNPYMAVRGVKFNIPLDVRTPSYTDVSDAAQKNMAEMWDFDFWTDYIDHLARFRYNSISLWNLHPFPSMVKVPDFPDVALDDVHQSTADFKENYNLNAIGFDVPELVDNFKIIKKMTIDEKITFWQKVMEYGKDRNIKFYIVTWNIFTNGTFGKYGITDKLENSVTKEYFRKSVEQMILTYPDLAGIGFTTGENMYAYNGIEKENWAFETYGKGVLNAINAQPGKKFTLIHRQHQSGAKEIMDKFTPLLSHPDIKFLFSFKYAEAHVYSSVNQVKHQNFIKDIQQAGNMKTLWTLRNDDVFHFRWGAPDFVRDFMTNLPSGVSEGYFYGSDQYVWGREFMDNSPESPRQIEVEKHWYQWMLWGRLGYEPGLKNNRFIDILQTRFPQTDAKQLFEVWQHASMIYPLVTGFHWGALDFQWYIESGQSRPDPAGTPSGYHDVNRFITLPPHRGTGYSSIPDYTGSIASGKKNEGISPLEVAQMINEHSEKAIKWASTFQTNGNTELRKTRDDVTSMAWLGKYYSAKIQGATNLSLFRKTLNKSYSDSTISYLTQSAAAWRRYASVSLSNYQNPLWTNRVGYVDWKENFKYVLYDITANGGAIALPSMPPTPGGTILEAEDALYRVSVKKNSRPGYSGTGYLETNAGDAHHQVSWTYTAPEAGIYTLEFRYTVTRQELFPSPVVINGEKVKDITFWMTGSPECWVWDRTIVTLRKGENTISISPEGFVLLDHLNILHN